MAEWGPGVNQLDTSETGDSKESGFNKVKAVIADIYSKANSLRMLRSGTVEPLDIIEKELWYNDSDNGLYRRGPNTSKLAILSFTFKGPIITDVLAFEGLVVGEDWTAAIQAAVNAGGYVLLHNAVTYKVTNSINVPANREINLNGATLDFELTSTVPGFNVIGDNVTIRNGTINVVGTTMGGSGPSLACISAGRQTDGVGYKNLRFSELTVSTNRNDAGASIAIFGECSNVKIEDISIPDNANCRNIIGCEWGGTSAGTGHPHDITIRNIKCGRLTYPSSGAGGFGYAVWLSAAFNVAVENISVVEGYGLVMATAGDRAQEYAPTTYKDRVGTGISIKNASISECFGYGVRVIGKASSSATYCDMSVLAENINVTAKVGAVGNVFGMEAEYCKGAKLNGFKFDGCAAGYATGADVKYPIVENGRILNSKLYGLSFGSSGGNSIKPVARNVHFQGNNANNGASTSTAAALLTYAKEPLIENCTFGEVGVTETQKYSIACTANTVNPRLNNNHTYNLASSGVSYVINTSSTPEINARGTNNTSEPGLANHSGAPIFTINSMGNREFVLPTNAAPTAGTWAVGDTGWYPAPVAAGFSGVKCVTAGTPGTWKTFGAITA